MLLNEGKCKFMIIEPTWTSRNEVETIKFENRTIEEIDKGKLLGITFDNKLTMNNPIKHICTLNPT